MTASLYQRLSSCRSEAGFCCCDFWSMESWAVDSCKGITYWMDPEVNGPDTQAVSPCNDCINAPPEMFNQCLWEKQPMLRKNGRARGRVARFGVSAHF